MVGIDMIRSAELQSILFDINKFKSAANTFQMKYNCLPGDCPKASGYSLGNNGNGNGNIDEGWCDSVPDYSTAANVEIFLFWQHLANAGLIPGTFTGQPGPANAITAILNVNVPSSKVSGGGFSFGNILAGSQCNVVLFSSANYNNYIALGSQINSGDQMQGPILTPKEAMSLDQKIDDGYPSTGNVVTLVPLWFDGNGFPVCVTSTNPPAYNTSLNTRACHLLFTQAF